MANQVFKVDKKGLVKMLQSQEMQTLVINEANKRAGGEKVESFVGFDRAKAFIGGKKK